MLDFLKNHPFAVEAFFESSIVLTYAVDKEELANKIPPCLSLDCFEDKWAFIAVALVQTKNLRPKGFPSFMGNDFFLIGYRIFVRYRNAQGKSLRGLYILGSETDKKKMEWLGNVFTHYKYNSTDIHFLDKGEKIEVRSVKSGIDVQLCDPGEEVSLPQQSPFKNWKEARRFAGPLPFTFSYLEQKKQVLIVEGVREDWQPRPLEVKDQKVSFVEGLGLRSAVLANAFVVRNIPYYWKKGRIEPWN